MTIYNCTPHSINIFSSEDVDMSNPRRLFAKAGASAVVTIPPSGVVLNAQIDRQEAGSLEVNDIEVPLVKQGFIGVDNPFTLIEGAKANDIFIVSALFRSAAQAVGMAGTFACVDGVVYATPDDIRPVGCLGLSV